MVKIRKKSEYNITKETDEEVGEKLKKIKAFEKKGADRLGFELDAGAFMTICFKTKEHRDEICLKFGIKLECDNHVVFDKWLDRLQKKEKFIPQILGFFNNLLKGIR